MSKKEIATELFLNGCNCAQAVLGAFCEELELERETAMKLSSSFGGGIGRMREVCGAVSGMCMVLGLARGYTPESEHSAKGEHYKLIREAVEEFRRANGSYICKELLGVEAAPESATPEKRSETYYKKRPCAELVGIAAEITENILKS